MSINTYGELKTAVAQWLNRKDLDEFIPTFISLAETKIFREMRSPANEQVVTYKTGSGDTTIVIPADLLELKLLLIDDQEYKYISPNEFYRNSKEGYNKYTGTRRFTRVNNVYVLPDALKGSESIVMLYWADFSGMNDDDDFNSILRTAKDLYLYGALIEAEPFVKNDERMVIWKSMYDEAYARLNQYNKRLDWGSNTPQVQGGY